LPAITRKTDKGLPKYQDGSESDVFILSGAEDLVPAFEKNLDGECIKDENGDFDIDEDGGDAYWVRRYLPRIEGLFARIERWKRKADGDIHWRSISKDNVLTVYGRNGQSRIADPADDGRVFSWMICESYDDKGNAILYEYAPENDSNIDSRLANERNRSRTANRYIKRIRYGNRKPLLLDTTVPSFRGSHLVQPDFTSAGWMFEVVFDYDERHYEEIPLDPAKSEAEQHRLVRASASASDGWSCRPDPFSVYRAGFEVRAYRRCYRVLLFHQFPELGSEPCLVRSTEFDYSDLNYREPIPVETELGHKGSTRFASFICAVTQSGYTRDKTRPVVILNGVKFSTYIKKSLPRLEFDYSPSAIHENVVGIDTKSLENLPCGVDGALYRWADLDSEGLPGILTEQEEMWFYKPNLGSGKFGPQKKIAVKPSLAALSGGRQQLLDLAGDGRLDVVEFDGPVPGFFERTQDDGWENFRPFVSLPNISWRDPNLRFVDLTGDGHADVMIVKGEVLAWYPSLAEEGFSPAAEILMPLDEEKGPRLVSDDGTQSICLADMSGDGLADLVRIRNGEVSYWPNLGYGRFGAKVTMDNAPLFDPVNQFNPKCVRLTDIDGSGTTDIIYLSSNGVRIYFNQSGNRWSAARKLSNFPRIDNMSFIDVADLFGNGTSCLVWSSSLPGDFARSMSYIDLMGGQKPHLLVGSKNNLGVETRIRYASSTKFYLEDKTAGKARISLLPFPVSVVERVETYDWIGRTRFVTRYAYHYGNYDSLDREFRGFGMVEQWDTEEFATLKHSDAFPIGTNVDAASQVPPVLTKTWFHTGVHLGRQSVSDFFAGLLDGRDVGEYYRELGLTDDQARALLLEDTVLPLDLSLEEEREACRALKGSMLRQEVYALDSTPKTAHPYTVVEQNFTVRCVQPRGGNRHAVFFTHAREAIKYHYERDPADPRISHALTLDVDKYGNVLKSLSIGYGRRPGSTILLDDDKKKQEQTLITYTEAVFTNSIDDSAAYPESYRTPLPCEARTFEVTGLTPAVGAIRFTFGEFADNDFQKILTLPEIEYEQPTDYTKKQRRLIGHVRTLYRPDDLGSALNDSLKLLPLRTLEPLALPGESYKLAFTPGLLAQVFRRNGQFLLPNVANVLGGQSADSGGYQPSQQLKLDGRFPDTDLDDRWWIPSGRVFYSPTTNDRAAQELAFARQHFFLPHRYRDPFNIGGVSTESLIFFDAHDLLIVESRDPVGNRVTVGERLPNGDIDSSKPGNDYRTLRPWRVMDPNRNRTEVAFDTLGIVVGTAAMGKPEEMQGDSLVDFVVDLNEAVALDHLTNPLADPHSILARATTRLVYDVFAYQRSRDSPEPQPVVVYILVRETHNSDLDQGQLTKVQHVFSYSDGFGRDIQRKAQAEPEKINGAVGPPRWVGSGWTIFNNKGNPVRQYEPFFAVTHGFEFGVQLGVSSILFYDPIQRVVATLHPNHTYEKLVFNPWQQVTYDANDTAAAHDRQTGDPRTDPDIEGYMAGYFASLSPNPAEPWQTWQEQRKDGMLGSQEQAAARKASVHADTPTTVHFDALGRPFLTAVPNRFERKRSDNTIETVEEPPCHTRVELDIEGNQRSVRNGIEQQGDNLGRIAMRYAYDMLGNRIHQSNMDAGQRWTLNDVTGKPIRCWDSRGHVVRTEYDPIRRPLRVFVTGADPANPNLELLTERLVYGEQHPEDELRNLRGRVFLHFDQAGIVGNEAYDFKGNTLRISRRIAKEYKHAINWNSVNLTLPANITVKFNPAALEAALASQLEAEIFISLTTHDALNRRVTLTTPHTPTMQPSVVRHSYNEANLLERVDANLRGDKANGQPVWVAIVTNIDYDAKGQRQRIDYGNGANSFYEYDPLTFRLIHLFTRRNAIAFPDDCPQPPPDCWPGCCVQNLHYTYDPVGNITHIRDDAQQTIFFRNKRVEPSADYIYDALYRLIEATGREHLGQVGGVSIPHSYNDAPRVGIAWSANDGNTMGTYTERYMYDAVGNILEMQHRGHDPALAGWTRCYTYDKTSLIEDGTSGTLLKTSNRLSSTSIGNSNPAVADYAYDAHGNMVRMPHLGGANRDPNMCWDYRDQLCRTGSGGNDTEYYAYDATGQRVRKVWEKSLGLTEERLYLDGFELARRRNGAGTVTRERETLHIMDDKQRIVLVETRTIDTAGDDPEIQTLIRYQLGNHLGSASLELDDRGKIISYEEYTPYGSTSYQAMDKDIKAPAKRYRYAGKERDVGSGFCYHGARYYAPWLGRWTSCDPSPEEYRIMTPYAGMKDNPIKIVDLDGREPLSYDDFKTKILDPALKMGVPRERLEILVHAWIQTVKQNDTLHGIRYAKEGWKKGESPPGFLVIPGREPAKGAEDITGVRGGVVVGNFNAETGWYGSASKCNIYDYNVNTFAGWQMPFVPAGVPGPSFRPQDLAAAHGFPVPSSYYSDVQRGPGATKRKEYLDEIRKATDVIKLKDAMPGDILVLLKGFTHMGELATKVTITREGKSASAEFGYFEAAENEAKYTPHKKLRSKDVIVLRPKNRLDSWLRQQADIDVSDKALSGQDPTSQ
jgi:RHS repeat-associated protein